MDWRKSLNSDGTNSSSASRRASRPPRLAASLIEGEPKPMEMGGGTHPTKRLGPASARPATLPPTSQPDAMLGRSMPVTGKWRMFGVFEAMIGVFEVCQIVLSLTSHATPAHVEVAGPLRRKVAVPSGIGVPPAGGLLLKMLMSIS